MSFLIIFFFFNVSYAGLFEDVFFGRLVWEPQIPRSEIASMYNVLPDDIADVEDVLIRLSKSLSRTRCHESMRNPKIKSVTGRDWSGTDYYISYEDINRARLVLNTRSLNAPLGENEDSATLEEMLKDRYFPNPMDEVAEEEIKDIIINAFNDILSRWPIDSHKRITEIFYERILERKDTTLQNIADRYGVTRQAVHLHEKKLIQQIHEELRKRFLGKRNGDEKGDGDGDGDGEE